MKIPVFMRMLSIPGLNRLMTRIQPVSVESTRAIYRQIGHDVSLDVGQIPDIFFEWGCHLMKDTDTMRWEVSTIEKAITWRGMRRDLCFEEQDLRQVPQPTLFLWGEDDPFGGTELGRRVTATMPDAKLHSLPKSGHLPWLDDAEKLAIRTRDFLRAESAQTAVE
jgi:pimeloyl-ACP methyl ester carboxylesterase